MENNKKQRQALRSRKSYLKHKEKVLERNKKRRKRYRDWYLDIMKDKSCTYCPENDVACMEWHHLNPDLKDSGISNMIRNEKSFNLILNEMKKCIVVCANCHRKLHYGKYKLVGHNGIEPFTLRV